ncbi:hypothetical protein O6H91_08G073800 [Diphasiastrum complanatum]|uniref:Uncharacterized protein n=1 Tax=Diphasiastrum complanatum TaxID=34168 RepID=A0ACC2CYX6_DIPCM|nr:hypothetical protein O6H91_Y464700 [Diphasiastrum complanatum]KAJ7547192.1 hypothetical protein O6H91_08G073800 [Diphasiastrum complanatum]
MLGAFGSHSVALRPLISRIAIAILQLVSTQLANAQLQNNFHGVSCPGAEFTVRSVVDIALGKERGLGAGLVRMHFHDCFVNGCDGSVLIDSTPGNPSEKDAAPNFGTLRGFEIIDAAKAQLEANCPGVVSCADILAFAARDSVSFLGGIFWLVKSGRRDGNISRASDVVNNLPGPSFNLQALTQSFLAKGLSQTEMITLSGAHTIGQAHCAAFTDRLYNFNSNGSQDPSLDPEYAKRLKLLCPQNNTNPNTVVPLDPLTADIFDNSYFTNVVTGQALFSSDEALFTDTATIATVQSNSLNGFPWSLDFAQAMIKMSEIGVLTGQQGEIRKNCRVINS